MKSLIIYSSRTGNTKAVATHIAAALSEATLCDAAQMPENLDDFDLIFVGFWAYRRGADPVATKILENLHGKRVAIFGTAGAYPETEAGQNYLKTAAALLPKDAAYLGGFLCQGRVASFHRFLETGERASGHELSEERRVRLTEAESHPNETDFAAAAEFAKTVEKG